MARRLAGPLIAAAVLSACASGALGRTFELSGTPSDTGCDARFEMGGRYGAVNDATFTLTNRSTSPSCVVTRVTFLFVDQLPPGALRITTPDGWTQWDAPCDAGPGPCGVEWRSRTGVPAGGTLAGFGLSWRPSQTPRPREWRIDLGPRRVRMPIGVVGG